MSCSGATVCTDCDPGYFADAEQSGQCSPCPKGSATNRTGAASFDLVCSAGNSAHVRSCVGWQARPAALCALPATSLPPRACCTAPFAVSNSLFRFCLCNFQISVLLCSCRTRPAPARPDRLRFVQAGACEPPWARAFRGTLIVRCG